MDAQRWESEALRESRARRSGRPAVSQSRRPVRNAVWVTLREASETTGIPVGTLGTWARRGTVDSYLETKGGRRLRIIDLNGVRSRAIELGRPISSHENPPSPPVSSAPSQTGSALSAESMETMIVPIDAWNKMLNQLGNLHEAGQQLAEARERAAKAETEALFLRERLSELRDTPPPPSREVAAAAAAAGGSHATVDETASTAGGERSGGAPAVWRYLSTGWKSRRR